MNSTVRTRPFIGGFFTARARMSSNKKSPTHYETLEVNPRATQSQIKSAYFNLSKQYHPDKNSSDEAKEKFRNVADAYEIIGNFDSRKHYDRSLLTNTHYQGRQRSVKTDDPKIKYYQSQAAVFKSEKPGGSQPLYDFDAWTKAHYGRTFEKTIKRRAEGLRRRQERMENHIPLFYGKDGLFVTAAIAFLLALAYLGMRDANRYDNRFSVVRHKDKFEEKESPLTKT